MNKTILFGGSGFFGPVILKKNPGIISVGRSKPPKDIVNKHINFGSLDNLKFLDDIDYLIKNQIIVIPSQKIIDDLQQQIPSWVKNNAGWLADGTIDDETFLQGIQYLIKEGIIQIP